MHVIMSLGKILFKFNNVLFTQPLCHEKDAIGRQLFFADKSRVNSKYSIS